MQLYSLRTYFFRKLTMIIILQFIIALHAHAKFCADTSTGIYFTKEQFEIDELQLKSCYWIRENGPIIWSDFAYEASGTIKIKVSKGNIKTFEPGSIYGFKKDGIKFMFVKSLNQYLAILYENPSVYLFMKEDVYFLYHQTKRVIFLYATNIDSSFLKKFNKQNILKDFSNNLKLEKKLLDLFEKIDREKTYFPYKDFFKWQKKVEDYLN